jgi:hypothetical protein
MCHHRNALLPPIWTLSHALTDQTTIHSSLYHVYMLSPLSCKRNQIQDRSIHVKSSAKKLGSKVEREGYGQQFQLPTQITFRMNRKSKFQTRKRAHIWPSFLHYHVISRWGFENERSTGLIGPYHLHGIAWRLSFRFPRPPSRHMGHGYVPDYDRFKNQDGEARSSRRSEQHEW